MTRISYDEVSQCWREDPNGDYWGIWDEKLGWVAKYKVGVNYSE